MSDINITVRFDKPGCDWQITLVDPKQVEGGMLAKNFVLVRANGKHFHTTLVEGEALNENKETFHFWQPMSFEHDSGRNKVGDVVLVFRKSPDPVGRWMVQVDQEDVYIDETTIRKIWRAIRSSLDNIIQAVKREVVETGRAYANPRRLGGNSISQHYVHAAWSPQLANQMMDVFNYVQSLDSMGQSTLLKALQHMPFEMATEIFKQIRAPHYNGSVQE
jgi:hypothetical protein